MKNEKVKKIRLDTDDLEYVNGGIDERKVKEQIKDRIRKENEASAIKTAIQFDTENSGMKIF